MAKQGVLRGRGEFARVFAAGRRVSSGFIRATYIVTDRQRDALRFGISISRGSGNAVRRNRMRRLIREAIRAERGNLSEAYSRAGLSIDLIVRFTPGDVQSIRHLSLQPVQQEIRKVFQTIAGRAKKGVI